MNFGLLWIDALLISLLWVMTLAACIGRLKRQWLRRLLVSLCAALPMLLWGVFAFATAEMKFVAHIEPNWFGYALSLLLTFILSLALILWRASRREPGCAPASASWRRAPLALACLGSAAVGYITLLNMDVALRARCAILSVEVNSIYLTTLPAITSDAQNAAPLYETAFARLRADREQEEKVQNPPTGNGEKFDPDEPATIEFLKSEAGTIALLRRAAALPACRFDQDLAVPDINAMMPHLSECRNAGDILSLDAREELARGHNTSAIADTTAILEMSRHFGRRPLLISALVGAGLDAIGVKTLELALPAVRSPDELAALHLDELPSMGRVFQQAMRGEERYGLLLYGEFPPGTSTDLASTSTDLEDQEFQSQHRLLMGSRAGAVGMIFRAFILDLDAYLDLMRNLQDAAPQPYYVVHDQIRHMFGLDHSRGLFTSILAPSLIRAFTIMSIGEANDACAQVAVAMTRFRLDHGSLPPHLDDLVPAYLNAVPIDPFDGHPLRLAVRNNDWVIYSIGPDGIDDGGVAMVGNKGDVIFTLKSPAHEATTLP